MPATAVRLAGVPKARNSRPNPELVAAVTRCSPGTGPSVQPPRVTWPEASLTWLAPVSEPPPLVTKKETDTPWTPLPN